MQHIEGHSFIFEHLCTGECKNVPSRPKDHPYDPTKPASWKNNPSYIPKIILQKALSSSNIKSTSVLLPCGYPALGCTCGVGGGIQLRYECHKNRWISIIEPEVCGHTKECLVKIGMDPVYELKVESNTELIVPVTTPKRCTPPELIDEDSMFLDYEVPSTRTKKAKRSVKSSKRRNKRKEWVKELGDKQI